MSHEQHTGIPTRELANKAKLLKESPYFVGNTDASRLYEKQTIFLAVAGLKPVSEAASGHWVQTPTGRRSEPDNPDRLGELLSSLKLAYELLPRDYATVAVVSRRADVLGAYLHTQDNPLEIGLLLGYPKTAVTAFVNDESMPFEEQARLVGSLGLAALRHEAW